MEEAQEPDNELLLEDDLSAMRDMVNQMARFIAIYEQASQKIERHEVASGQRLAESENYFRTRIEEINSAIVGMQGMMTEVGVARFSVAAEAALRDGQGHVAALRDASGELHAQLQQSLLQLEKSVKTAAENVERAAKQVRLEELKELTLAATETINTTTDRAVRRLTGTLSWLHWERISVIFIIALVVALVSSFAGSHFSKDNTPQVVTQEQQAGKATLRAWSQLSKSDQVLIKQALQGGV